MYSAYTSIVGPAPRCCGSYAKDWAFQRGCGSTLRAKHVARTTLQPALSKRQIVVQAVQAPARPTEVQPEMGTAVLNSDVGGGARPDLVLQDESQPYVRVKVWTPPSGVAEAVVVFMHGTWVTPEVYGLQLDRLAAGGVLVLAPCGVEGLAGFAQFFNPDMKTFQSAYQGAMFDSAKEAVRQLRDPAGGPLLDQLRAARPGIKSLQDLRWGFFGHSVGADLVFLLSLQYMKSWGDVAGGVASVNPTGKLAILDLASEDCLLYPGLGKATRPTTASVVIGLADIIAPAFGSLPGVMAPLRGGACKAFAMPFGDFLLDPSGQHTDALDFLPSIKGESLLPKLFPLLRLLPGVSYLRALEVVALLPGEAELDLRPGALDDGRERQGGGDGVRKPFDAEHMQAADSDQRFWGGLLAATAALTVIKLVVTIMEHHFNAGDATSVIVGLLLSGFLSWGLWRGEHVQVIKNDVGMFLLSRLTF